MGTIAYDGHGIDFGKHFTDGGFTELRGQRELGAGGFDHYQLLVGLVKPQRRSWLVARFGTGHWEPTRSASARDYVHKELTRVPGSQFAYGMVPGF